ncbi:hypothetical protein O6H91_Y427200 [Diphasiastrum complanatum]|nr:hypothetical protein O6H91_Y427200 [Diphasiastrum complanatum]
MRIVQRNSQTRQSSRVSGVQNSKALVGSYAFNTPVRIRVSGEDCDCHEACGLGPESRMESLSLELLVNIVCGLKHDELKPVSQVCRRFRQAVEVAWRCHFNFQTPGRKRHRQSKCLSPPFEHHNLLLGPRINHICDHKEKPDTPNAPKQLQKPLQAHISADQMRPLVAVLFQDRDNCQSKRRDTDIVRPKIKALNSHCTIFNEELCEAVGHNTL